MNRKLLKGFAGIAKFGLKLTTFSLILVFSLSILWALADEAVTISGFGVATSRANGTATTTGDQISKNDTQELFNFTLTLQGNISNITILVPAFAVSSDYANISVSNTTIVQLGTNLTGWVVTYVTNFTVTGDPFRIQLNTSDPSLMLGNNSATSNTIWFAFNGTPKVSGATPRDNHTMTWELYASNASHTNNTATKLTTLVDNKLPTIFNVIPKLNSTRQSYLGGTSADLFQVNVSEANLNVSSSASNDGSVNATLWIKRSQIIAWSKQTLLCYNATGGFKPDGPTNNLYTCNTTLDLISGGFLGSLAEGSIVQFFFNATDLVLNTGFNGTQAYPLNATIDRTSPTSTNILSNVSYAKNTSYVTLSARFSDTYDLANATLATNESGTWTNYTANETSIGSSTGSYGSPWDMGTATAYDVNFTWKNDSIASNTIVAWQIRATDEAGNQHTTVLQSFVVDVTAPAVGIVSHTARQNVSGTITVNVSINDTASGVSTATLNISNSTSRAIGGLKVMSTGGNVAGYYNVTYDTTTLPDGNFTIRIYANDTVDNVNDTQTVLFQADNAAPNIRILGPAANANITGPFNITAEINDVIWVSYVQYKISNATSQLVPVFIQMTNNSGMNMSNGGVYNATNATSLLGDGIYNITVWANDSVNNIAQVNVSVYIDNNAPTLINLDTTLNVANVTSPASGAVFFPGRSYTFNISATDNIGVFYVIARVNGTNYTTTQYGDVTGRARNFSTTITDLAAMAGGHEVQWYINDTTGNQRNENAWKYVIAQNTSAYAAISANQTTVERGTYFNVTSRAYANAGILTTVNATMFANTTPGDITLQPIITADRETGGETWNRTSSAILPVGPINFTANITVHENYTINSTAASVIINIVDTIAPPVVFLNRTDTSTYVNGTIRKTGGTITLNVSAFENTNGWGFPNNLTVNVYVNVTNGAQVFIGNLTNTSGYGMFTTTSAGGIITIPAGLTDGNLTFNFTVADKQGNIGFNDTSRGSNFVVSIDNTAPALLGPVPLNSTFNKGTATELFQINVTEVNLNITQNITLYWGFTPTTAASRSKTLLCTGAGQDLYVFVGPNWICNTTLDLTLQLADGESIYYFFNTSNATHPGGDLAGNAGSYGNVFIPLNSTVDRAVPSVGVLLPLGSANVSGSFTLNISANNTPAGVSNVSYRITNNTFQSEMILLTRGAGTAFAGYWNGTNNTVVPGLADGIYRISINATDFTGWQNTTVNVTIFIDNTKPNVTIVTPTTGLNFSTSIIINATVRDSGVSYAVAAGDIASVQYYLSNSTWPGSLLAMTNESSAGKAFFDMYNATNFTNANLADGRYNITIIATDYAGNVNNSQNVTIGIDRNAPSVSIRSPTANQYIKGEFNISAEVNDGVWVSHVQYRISNATVVNVIDQPYMRMSNNSVNATGGGIYNATNTTNGALFADGTYNITIIANDTVGFITYANVSVTIDNNAPVQWEPAFNSSEPASGTKYVPGTFYRFNKTFNDTVGVSVVILQVNATNYTAFRSDGSATNGNWSANVTDLAANTTGYPIIWYANDTAGNSLTTTAWYYVVNKNDSAYTRIILNATTVERGNFVNITIYSPIRAEINTTIYTNYSGTSASLTTFVPYPLNNQNITFTGMMKGIWNITANTTTTENYTANATLESVTFLVQDTTKPGLRIYDYVNGTAVKPGDSIRLNISITDNYGIDSAFNVSAFFNGTTIGSWVFAGNVSNSTFSSNASSAWANGTVTIPASGMNVAGNRTINITILDSSGNMGMNDSFVINMDPGAPTWTNNATSPGSDIQYFPGRTYKFNITLVDEPFGVSYVTMEFNGTNYTASRIAGTIYSGNWTANITDLAANTSITGYYFRWYMNDSSGQWNTSDWLNYTIYKNTSAYATISINQTTVERGDYVNITIRSTTRAEINTTIYTNYSGALASLTTFVPYPLNNQNITFTGMMKGIWNITANTTTTENYTANATLESVTFLVQDTTKPGLRIYDYVNGTAVKPGDTIKLNVSITDNYGIDSAFNVSAFFNGTTIGSWVFAGNISNSTFSSNASSAWANGTVTIPASGMNVAGNRTINITILDSSGNMGMNDSFVINMDPGAPTWTTNSTTPGSDIQYYPGRTYHFNVSLTDEPFGVGSVFLEFNGTNYTASRFGGTIYSGNWSVSMTDLAANTSVTGYYFRWYMNDTFNQWNTSDWLNYTIYKNSSAYAVLSVNVSIAERGTYVNITSYSPISTVINTTLYANFSAVTLSAINFVPYPAGNQNITYVGTNLNVGPYNITANTTASQNYSFNSTVQTFVLTVQDSAPWSEFKSPLNNTNFTETMLINATVMDQGGVDTNNVRYNISNTTWAGTTGYLNSTLNMANHYNASVNTASIVDGNYNLTILANDTFGNLNSTYYIKISIDHTAPTVIFNYNGTVNVDGFTPFNSTYRRGVISINFTVSDVYAGINNNTMLVRIGNLTHWQGPVVYAVNGTPSTFNFTNMTTVLADGLYNFTVTANDTQGNTITNATFVMVDNTAPSLYANTSGNKVGTNESQDITVTMFDAQTNATLDLYYRYAYPPAGISTQWYYARITGTVGSATMYRTAANITLVGGGRSIEYYVVGTDNATNAISNIANNASYPLGYFNITSVDSVSPVFTEIGANQSVVRSGQTVLITFKASETLSTYPVVTLNNVYYANRTSNGTNLVYTYNYTIQGSEGDGPATISVTGTDTAGNSGTSTCVSGSNCTGANSGFVIDAKAPAVTIWSPISGNFNTLSVGITTTTDENAECRYDETSVAYASMSYAMAGAGTAHSATVNASQGTNTYYARCQDTAGNANTTSATITFTVDSLAPSIVTGGPNGTRTSSSVTLQANTSEPGTCKYGSQDVLFESMDAVMTGTGTAHTAALAGLLDSRASIYYVRCNDTSVPVNMMNASAVIQFGVDTRGNFNLTRPSTWADYFTTGWNRIALTQTELENTSITTYNMTNVLTSMTNPTYFTILYFNNASTASTWVSYAPGRAVNDLTLFNNQDPAKEYLVYVNATGKRLQIN